MIPNPLVGPLRNIIVFNRRKIYLDNVPFRVHYTWTVIVLVTCSILVTSKLYIGDPINCLSSGDVKIIADQYCFIHSTYTKGKFEQGKWAYAPIKETEISPGVHPSTKNETIITHVYYQWVWIVLWIQAMLFYWPHWIWEKWEGGRVKMLVGDLNLPMLFDDKKAKQRIKICNYFATNRGYHGSYALSHVFCETLNLVNIVIQIYLTDYFVNWEFSRFGLKLFNLTYTRPYLRDDALARVFPTVTACRIATGGVAFGKVQHDILCVLPINILNEKIYIFLWFWFILVLAFTFAGIIIRISTLFPTIRKWLLKRRARFVTKEQVNAVVDLNVYGDWFLIHKLSQNIDPVAFSDVIIQLLDSFTEAKRKRSTFLEVGESPNAPPESPLLEIHVSESP